MWFIGVEVEQETSAPPPKKNPGSAPARSSTEQKTQVAFDNDVIKSVRKPGRKREIF